MIWSSHIELFSKACPVFCVLPGLNTYPKTNTYKMISSLKRLYWVNVEWFPTILLHWPILEDSSYRTSHFLWCCIYTVCEIYMAILFPLDSLIPYLTYHFTKILECETYNISFIVLTNTIYSEVKKNSLLIINFNSRI